METSTGDLHRLAHQTPVPLPQQSVPVSQNSGAVEVLHVPEPRPSSTTALPAYHHQLQDLHNVGHKRPSQSFLTLTSADVDVCRLHHCALPETRDTTPHQAGALAATFKGKFFPTEASLRRLKEVTAALKCVDINTKPLET